MPADLRRRWGTARPGKRLLAIASMALMLAGGGIGLTHTSVFSARTITVNGASHLSDAAVLRLAGVHPGTNVFYLDTTAIEARLLADPWVAGATVVRRLPVTIEITIREVRPVGVSASGDTPMLLAQDGSSLGMAPAGTRLPVIGAAGEGTLRDGAVVLAAMPPALLVRIESVAVAVDASVTLTLRSGVIVTFGDAGDAARKAEAMRAVLMWAKTQPIGVVSIDVSSPAVPTARLRGTTTATAVAPPSPSPGSPTPSP